MLSCVIKISEFPLFENVIRRMMMDKGLEPFLGEFVIFEKVWKIHIKKDWIYKHVIPAIISKKF